MLRPLFGSLAACAVGFSSLTASAATDVAASKPDWKPKRVLIAVFDQMKPEYVDQFDMDNLRQLRDGGVHFAQGYLGHAASETVVSHNVMVSGQFPKNMGWADEVFRDSENLLGKGKNAMWTTGSFTREQFNILVKHAGYPKLADYLHAAQPGSKFVVVGEKDYAVEAIAAPSADIAVRFSDRMKDLSKETGCDNLGGQWRGPAGVNVPTYLSEPRCGRFYVNSDKNNDYGTKAAAPSWLYPLDGNRFVPGNDPAHLGGDAWVADVAIAMAEKENWSGMLVTFGGIDKSGHMWGPGKPATILDGPAAQTQLPVVAKFADEQMGRLLDKLKALGQLEETLIVVTADHGAVAGWGNFHGSKAAGVSDNNWYFGDVVNGSGFDKPIPAIKPLVDTGNVAFSYQSTTVNTWLKDTSPAKKREMAKVMRSLPGVVATYWRDGGRYKLDTATKTASRMTKREHQWWQRHGQELMDTMAAEGSADVVGILGGGTTYSVSGDHGGIGEEEQRIPMFAWSAHIKREKPVTGFRSADILPTVLKAMGIKQTHKTDGKAYTLKFQAK
ncbi:alkaline phosphatase family protein [Chitinimonas sp. JJ19]|uniref:alkaline phosphatase family protein n=1 Tax=Chitinimonas sp. JJ19 TaxID=3109352 RepID=UPI003002D283